MPINRHTWGIHHERYPWLLSVDWTFSPIAFAFLLASTIQHWRWAKRDTVFLDCAKLVWWLFECLSRFWLFFLFQERQQTSFESSGWRKGRKSKTIDGSSKRQPTTSEKAMLMCVMMMPLLWWWCWLLTSYVGLGRTGYASSTSRWRRKQVRDCASARCSWMTIIVYLPFYDITW